MAWSSMKGSWGLRLLILGAVVLIEGESPVFAGEAVWWGSGAVLYPSSPLQLGV